jgi:hypothetical protein
LPVGSAGSGLNDAFCAWMAGSSLSSFLSDAHKAYISGEHILWNCGDESEACGVRLSDAPVVRHNNTGMTRVRAWEPVLCCLAGQIKEGAR